MLTGHSEKKRAVGARANPRPFIKTKTYFGPERRKGGKADVIRQQPLLDKVLSRSPGSDEENASREDGTPSVATFGDHEVITPLHEMRKVVTHVADSDGDPVARAEAALARLSTEFADWMHAEMRAARSGRA